MRDHIYNNAMSAIRVGVEDYLKGTDERLLSSVRNVYSGMLLLLKVVLIDRVPNEDPDIVLAARVEIAPDGCGGVKPTAQCVSAVDFDKLFTRLATFGVSISDDERRKLVRMQKQRNNIEHKYATVSANHIQGYLADSFGFLTYLFNEVLHVDMKTVLGEESYEQLVEIEQVYDAELRKCEAELSATRFDSDLVYDYLENA